MAKVKPVINKRGKHEELDTLSGDLLDPAVLPISADAGNVIVANDDGLFAKPVSNLKVRSLTESARTNDGRILTVGKLEFKNGDNDPSPTTAYTLASDVTRFALLQGQKPPLRNRLMLEQMLHIGGSARATSEYFVDLPLVLADSRATAENFVVSVERYVDSNPVLPGAQVIRITGTTTTDNYRYTLDWNNTPFAHAGILVQGSSGNGSYGITTNSISATRGAFTIARRGDFIIKVEGVFK